MTHYSNQKWPQVHKSRYGKVAIYRQVRTGAELFTLSWYVCKIRVRETTTNLPEAQSRAFEILELFKTGEPPKNPRKRESASLKNWSHVVGDVSFEEIVKHYALSHNLLPTIETHKVCSAYLRVKANSGIGSRYRQTLQQHLNKFSNLFGSREIASISTADVENYLLNFEDLRTRFNHRASLKGLFKWAKSQNYLKKSVVEDTELPKFKVKAPILFTAQELQKLVDVADDRSLPMLIAGAYSGLRMSEIGRVRWKDINWEERAFILTPDMTKTNRSRVAYFPESVEGVLRRLAVTARLHDREKLIQDTCTDHINELVKNSGILWKKNGLRKTYISCRIALTRNAAEVAEQCGNSPTVIQQNYKGLVTKSEAENWFDIIKYNDDDCN
jgi:integrase